MAKNTKNADKNAVKNTNVATAPATSNSLARLAELKAAQAKLAKEMQEMQSAVAAESARAKQEMADKFGSLPAQLGFSDWKAFYVEVAAFNRSLSTPGGTGRSKFTKEEINRAVQLYKDGRKADATPEERVAGSRSAICETIACSGPTLQNWLKAAGLVKERAIA